MDKKKNVSKKRDMINKKLSKKVDNYKKSIPMGNKKKYRFNILMLLLIVIFIVWLFLLIIRYNGYKDINERINKLDKLQNEIILINNNFNDIENLVKKIKEVNDKNKDISNDIDVVKKDIEVLDYKISKFGK